MPAWLEVSVDERSGLIGLISWRSHHSGMICRWNVWRKKKSASSFSHFKSGQCWIFVFQTNVQPLFFRSASKAPAKEKMERPLSTMSEASNYTGAPDNAPNAESPAGRVRSTLRKQHTRQNIRLQYCVFAALQVF